MFRRHVAGALVGLSLSPVLAFGAAPQPCPLSGSDVVARAMFNHLSDCYTAPPKTAVPHIAAAEMASAAFTSTAISFNGSDYFSNRESPMFSEAVSTHEALPGVGATAEVETASDE